jgi:hypothetical protein
MYKLHNVTYMGTTEQCVIRTDGPNSYTSIPFDPANTDYQAYLRWCEEGNTPIPADEPTAE